MDFDRIYKGQIIKYGPRVRALLAADPDFLSEFSEEESLDCILHVDAIDQYGVDFSCITECGNHKMISICVYDYESWSRQLGEELFVPAEMSECFISKDIYEPSNIRDVYEFDPAEEAANMDKFLTEEAGG